jgi:hypothetical protein
MDVQLPDGTIVQNIPDGTSKADLVAKLQANGMQVPSAWLTPPAQSGQTQQPGFLNQALGVLSRVGSYAANPAAQAEVAGHYISGLVAQPVAGLAGVAQGIGNAVDGALGNPVQMSAADRVAQVQNAMTYQPKTTDGKAISRAADKALGVIPAVLNKAGEATTDVATKLGASPEVAAGLGAGVNVAGNAGLMALGARGVRGATAAGDAAEGAASTAPGSAGATPPATPAALLQQSLDNGRSVGYRVSPNYDPNATFTDRLGQGIAGQANVENAYRAGNQGTTNALGARALSSPDLGISTSPQTLVTQSLLQQVRQSAIDKGYAPIADLPGKIPADAQFLRANQAIKNAHADEFSGNPDVAATADLLNRASFDPAKVTDMISTLRSRANDAFNQGRGDAGTAFKKQAGELEALVDRQIADTDGISPDLLPNYRAARQLIAKTYTIGDNLNPSTGNIDATGIGQVLKGGTKLDGDLKTIADFANAAPRITSAPNGAALPTSPLNTAAGMAAAHATGGLSMALIPAARMFASRWLQRHAQDPTTLQPSLQSSYGQTALNAIHGNSTAFAKMYGGLMPDAIANVPDARDYWR